MAGGAPTMLFCAGAVKAGTSWFTDYLRRHPECHLRSVKELHYFDLLEAGGFGARIRKLGREIAEHEAELADAAPQSHGWRQRQLADKRQLQAVLIGGGDQVGAYLEYLTGGAGGRRLVADMTPEYGLLPVDALRRLGGLLADVRFVLILRDPVARLWSHIRMLVRRMALPEAAIAAACEAKLAEVCAGGAEDVTRRSDYRGIYGRLAAAIPEARRKVVFYERLISEAGIREMTGFLGLAYVAPDLARRVHEGVAVAISDAQRARAAVWLQDQYDFVADTFGLPQEWSAGADGLRGVA